MTDTEILARIVVGIVILAFAVAIILRAEAIR